MFSCIQSAAGVIYMRFLQSSWQAVEVLGQVLGTALTWVALSAVLGVGVVHPMPPEGMHFLPDAQLLPEFSSTGVLPKTPNKANLPTGS